MELVRLTLPSLLISKLVIAVLVRKYNNNGREPEWADPKLGMRNCPKMNFKSRVYLVANMRYSGLVEFSLCPAWKGIFKFKFMWVRPLWFSARMLFIMYYITSNSVCDGLWSSCN